jgi:hypothetical protein
MANNYNYKTKDSMKASNITTTPSFTYDTSFVNVPITIASLFDSNTTALPTLINDNIVSTCIYGQSDISFSSTTTFKNSYSGMTDGGLLNYGTVNYFSVDNLAFQQYKYQGSSVIQAGTFTISATNGSATVSFPNSFLNIPIVVVCPTGNLSSPQIICCSIVSTTTTQFNTLSYYKDGRNNQDGGGVYYSNVGGSTYPGTFNYIAVDSAAIILAYKFGGGPIIKCGTFTTVSGTATVTGLGFNNGTVKVFCSPIGTTSYFMITCTITAVSTTQFSVCAFFKDGRGGQRGGDVYDGPFNYIAVTTV